VHSLSNILEVLSSQDVLDEASILEALNKADLHRKKEKLLSELRHLAIDFRKMGKYGRLRATILTASALAGQEGFKEIESAGILLAPREATKKFGQFIKRIQQDCIREQRWAFLSDRLATYSTFIDLISATAPAIQIIREQSVKSIRFWAKRLLAIVELSFLGAYFDCQLDEGLAGIFARFDSPEACASSVSTVIAIANGIREFDTVDLGFPAIGDLHDPILGHLLVAGHLLDMTNDFARSISAFGYSLTVKEGASGAVFILSPPFPEFERSVQLGYIRGALGRGDTALENSGIDTSTPLSLKALADYFAEEIGPTAAAIVDADTRFRRVRVEMPLIPSLCKALAEGYFKDEEAELRGLSQDFMLPIQLKGAPPPQLTANLSYGDFAILYRLIRFFNLVDVALRRPYLSSDFTAFANSLVRIVRDKDVRELLALSGVAEAAIGDFLSVAAFETNDLGHYDLQYSLLLNIKSVRLPELPHPAREYVQLPAVTIASNATRNVQMKTGIRLHRDGHAFVEVVSDLLRQHFPAIVTEKRLRRGELKTEVDIALLCDSALYLIECKHSLTATGPHEMRDLWRDISRGISQVNRARQILEDADRRRAYLRAWFPKIDETAIGAIRIVCSVLSSHRLFSGLNIDGVLIRDFASLSRLLGEGTVGIGYENEDDKLVMMRFRIWKKDELTPQDIENYFSEASILHRMFESSMKQQNVYQAFGELTLVRDTYVYEFDSEEWQQYMERIGCMRLPDQIVESPKEKSYRELIDEMSQSTDDQKDQTVN
jgi:hypothetical protein